MPDNAPALPAANGFELRAQDNRQRGWTRIATTIFSLLVIGVALYQMRGVNLGSLHAMMPLSPVFWTAFVASYLAGPVSEWLIYRRLWRIGPEAIGPLLRKQIYNELLLGYLGEAYFYNWAREKLALATTPFGAVKDVAIMSAVAGNLMTVVLVLLALPFAGLLQLGGHAHEFAWSLGIVLATSTALLAFRGRIFSLDVKALRFVFAIHVCRIVAIAALSALMWYVVLPATPIAWWLVLAAIRLLISRLPLVPNKDVVFAGIAVFALGHQVEIGELLTLMAALLLVTHVVVGLTFALIDLLTGKSHGARD